MKDLIKIQVPHKLPFLAAQCWQTAGKIGHLNENQRLCIYEQAVMFRGVGLIDNHNELKYIEALNNKHHGLLNIKNLGPVLAEGIA